MSEHNGAGPKDFVSLFIEAHKEYESPTSFWKWAAYSIVGSMLRSKVWFQHKNVKIFPNTYVVFLADSAQYRKGEPIGAARRLLGLVNHTKVFSGTASIQAILDLLSQAIANKNSPAPLRGGSALITADELAAFFVADPRLIPLLTDIWTPREKYEYHLRSTSSITIDDLCPSLLAASNEIFLREVYDSRAVYGGLLGRTFMIKPDETRPANSLMGEDGQVAVDEKALVDGLFKIRELNGRVRFTKEAQETYHNWYIELYNSYKNHPDKTGVIQRMHTQVIKIAIIIAASHYTLEITKDMTDTAILSVADLRQNYELYVMSSGQSNLATIGAKFLASAYEKAGHKITRKEFLMKNWQEITSEDFEKLVVTLQAGGMLELDADMGGEIAYRLSPKCLATLGGKK